MAIVTATEVTVFTDISASAGTITSSGLIPIVQERINLITNNYFLTDMYVQGIFTFNTSANSITMDGAQFVDEGFIAGDEIHIYHSYRNDGYHTVSSVTANSVVITSATTMIAEPSGRSILVSVVSWPNAMKYIAAQMVKYDYDDRPKKSFGVTSRTLGPYSESFGGSAGSNPTPFGYPQELIDALSSYTIARLN
jgi:hypothetical protein